MYKRIIFMLLAVSVLCSSCSTVRSTVGTDKETERETVNKETEVTETESKETEVLDSSETEVETNLETETVDTNTSVRVEAIELDRYSVSIEIGKTEMPLVTMKPDNASNKKEIWTSSDEKIAKVNHYGNITGVSVGKCVVTVASEDNPEVKAQVDVTVKEQAGLTYIDGILIANKTYSLPSTYAPGEDATAVAALNKMFAAAKAEGVNLFTVSSYRSYQTQQTLYNNYVARDGVAAADRYSARAGHSEHQTGLAFDLNSLEQSWGETKEGKWLAANCHKYGFIIRYPKDKENVTGYMYEPWHVRYLGVDTATKVYNSGKCLEEYLGITSQYAN